MLHRHAANAVSALRIALTPVFLFAVWRASVAGASGWWAAGIFAVIASSDVVDGRIARHVGATSAMGRALDHGADLGFILAALALYARLGLVPWWVPAAIAASFAAYVADSLRRSGVRPSLIGSRIGHLGGVANYVLIGVLVGNETVALHWLPAGLMTRLCALVPLYSGASIVSRLASRSTPPAAAEAPRAPLAKPDAGDERAATSEVR